MALSYDSGEQLFGSRIDDGEIVETAAPGTDRYARQAARWGWWLATTAFEDAYAGNGNDSAATAYMEELAVPWFHRYLGLAPAPDLDLDRWEQRAQEDFGPFDERWPANQGRDSFNCPDPSFKIPVSLQDKYLRYRQDIDDAFTQDDFDQIIGVYSSGMPLLYTASTILDAEPVLLRYSTERRDDDEVMITDTMEQRLDADEADLFIAEDHMFQGRTMANVGHYLFEHGADSIITMFAIDSPLERDIHRHGDTIAIERDERSIILGDHFRKPIHELT